MSEAPSGEVWAPTLVQEVLSVSRTSTQVVIVETDAGRGYLKALGNPAGEHALARELVGTRLAEALSLRTLRYALLNYDGTPEIRFHPPKGAPPGTLGAMARAGPAYVTRAEKLVTLEAGKVALEKVRNPSDFARLVVFDTWTINPDRYFPDESVRHPNRKNVAFSRAGEDGWLLRAMDHTHCITRQEHLSARASHIDHWQDERLYGLFPEFRPFMRAEYIRGAVDSLRAITREQIERSLEGVPPQWQVSVPVLRAVADLLWSRKEYVVDTIQDAIARALAQPPSAPEGAGGAGEAPGGGGRAGETP